MLAGLRALRADGTIRCVSLGMNAHAKVRKTLSWPRSWANFSLVSCIPAGMRGPTCIFWANLTSFSLKHNLTRGGAGGWTPRVITEFIEAAPSGTFDSCLLAYGWNLLNQDALEVLAG